MRKFGLAILVILVAVAFVAAGPTDSFAQQKKKIEKFGEDPRIKEWANKKWETSNKKFNMRMSDPWGGLNFHDISIHFADSVRACSGGRLDIKVFPTGAIVPAMEIFEATSKGTLDVFHSWSGYWKGRSEAFVAFASVPFGLDVEGYNIWYYERRALRPLQPEALLLRQRRPGAGTAFQQKSHQDGRFQGHEDPHARMVHGHPDHPRRLGHATARQRDLPGSRARRHRRLRVQHSGRQCPLRLP